MKRFLNSIKKILPSFKLKKYIFPQDSILLASSFREVVSFLNSLFGDSQPKTFPALLLSSS